MAVRLGSALFNADHAQLGAEVRRLEAAGIDFLHFDVFDGYMVPDQGFPARTIAALRPLTRLPFEVHLVANEPLRFLPALAEAGVDLVFLPAESTPLLYEALFAVRELHLRAGLCLALGTPLQGLLEAIPLLDAVLLLGRVTGEGSRGRTFNQRAIERARVARAAIDEAGVQVDLQVAGGLELESSRAAVMAGATSLPLGAALHRQADLAAYLRTLRQDLAGTGQASAAHTPAPSLRPATSGPYRVLVASRSFGKNVPEVLDRLREEGCELISNAADRAPTEDDLLARIGDVDALVSGTEPVTARVLAAAPRLKVIAKHGVGYENIDLTAARERGIVVAIAAGAIEESVADLTLALLLALARDVPAGAAAVRAGRWPRLAGMELRGKTLGIVGLGAIGKAVCRRAVAFGLRVVAHDVRQDPVFAVQHGVEYLELEDLLRRSDIVSLHAPVLPSTRHLINAARLALLKPTAYLINTARGELVDEEALAHALTAGALAGAALDVFSQEPPGPDHPLIGLPNVLPTPHSAGQTLEGLRRMGEITAENLLRVLHGEQPLHAV